MGSEKTRRLIGMSDLFELAACALRYPDRALVASLCGGAFFEDWEACLADVRAPEPLASHAMQAQKLLAGRAVEDLFEELRREQSRLWYALGPDVAVWPYESAYLHAQRGLPGAPVLFGSPVARDVEAQMREAGVLLSDVATEPIDSASNELEFLSYLHAMVARALTAGEGPQTDAGRSRDAGEGTPEADDGALSDAQDAQTDVAFWAERIERFARDHALVWLPGFLEQTQAQTRSDVLAHLCALALQPLRLLS